MNKIPTLEEARLVSEKNFAVILEKELEQISNSIKIAMQAGHFYCNFPTISPEARKILKDLGYTVEYISLRSNSVVNQEQVNWRPEKPRTPSEFWM